MHIIKSRSEYSFGQAFAPLQKLVDMFPHNVGGIADRNGTWGHVAFSKAMKRAGKKPIFGVELAFVAEPKKREKQGILWVTLLAKNNEGLKELYQATTEASENFYYLPRLGLDKLKQFSHNLFLICASPAAFDHLPKNKNTFIEISPASPEILIREMNGSRIIEGWLSVATIDNYYLKADDRPAYEIVAGRMAESRIEPMHFLSETEWIAEFGQQYKYCGEALANAGAIADLCNAELPKAEMVGFDSDQTIEEVCISAAPSRGIDLSDPVYQARLQRELTLIQDKGFTDYFFVIADMLQYAKKHMLVGPARGSSCGSLVCYLMGITEIDPIPYNLLFERFIDLNRDDLPDIDIDFPDTKRDMVFKYLENKYGVECVARLGTVSRFKAKSTLAVASKALKIPPWEIEDFKNSIIERPAGDERANLCIKDSFADLPIGRQTLVKYPYLRVAEKMEGHAKHSGQHAAGVIVTSSPVDNYCSVDKRSGIAQIDKHDAEALDILKIDALGLRTLSILEDTLEQIGWPYEKLLRYPTDDKEAFKVLNDNRYHGIFQFEGQAVQGLCNQMLVEDFEDMASLTAIARPGPLASGGAYEFIKRRTGKERVEYMPLTEPMTNVTYGIVIYQEQVMQIVRDIGGLSWENVSAVRKAMGKTLGKEHFNKYWSDFRAGALDKGLELKEAFGIWENINTTGAYAFNRSHSVAYALVSYWCCVLKAHHPLEYAAACLRHAKDDEQSLNILRELSTAGYEYEPLNAKKSQLNWSVQDGILIGGLMGIKTVGLKTAEKLIAKRTTGQPLTDRESNLLINGETPFDHLFEGQDLWGHIKANPGKYNIESPFSDIRDITEDTPGTVLFIGKLKSKKSMVKEVSKGGGQYLNMVLEDDTGSIPCGVNVRNFQTWGKPILDNGKSGEWYMMKGKVVQTPTFRFRKVYVDRWKKLTGNKTYEN